MVTLEEYSIVNRHNDIEYRYFYRLLQSQYNGRLAYGVEVERDDYKNFVKVNDEKDYIELVSTQKKLVKNIVLNLCKNEVSPIHLVNVLGEFVDKHVDEFDVELLKEA